RGPGAAAEGRPTQRRLRPAPDRGRRRPALRPERGLALPPCREPPLHRPRGPAGPLLRPSPRGLHRRACERTRLTPAMISYIRYYRDCGARTRTTTEAAGDEGAHRLP